MKRLGAVAVMLALIAGPASALDDPNAASGGNVAPERFGALPGPLMRPDGPIRPSPVPPSPQLPEDLQPQLPEASGPGGAADPFGRGRFGRLPDLAYGTYQRGYFKTAYELALPRARNGDPAAQTLVAEILSRGLGVPRKPAEAASWYAAAAEQGVPEAQFQYALMLIDGNFVTKDVNAAYALMQAAAEAGNSFAQFNLAQMIVSREQGNAGLVQAVSYYERAAEAGVGDAQYAMAQLYANGAGNKPKDDAEARRWLARAARQGFDTAQLDLGTWLVEGRGGNRDREAGFAWLRRAAMGGNIAAQNRVAKLYMQGLGVEPSSIDAAAWYFLARRGGLIDPAMEDFLDGLTDEEQKDALQRANRLR